MPSSWRPFGSGEPMTARKIGSQSLPARRQILLAEDDGLGRAAADEGGADTVLGHGNLVSSEG